MVVQLVFSAVINSIGSWIRCIAIALPTDKRYPVVVVGQALAGIGGPFAYKYVVVHRNSKGCNDTALWRRLHDNTYTPSWPKTKI